jgi:hypothetical protein
MMDKNYALHLMDANKIPCAKTYFFNEDTDMRKALASIPGSHKYIFKPAGGAAGIGVYGNDGLSGICDVSRHIEDLNQSNKLPRRFQLQEFLPGIPYGCTAWLNEDGSFEMFEIHRQLINTTGRFTGGRWTPAIMEEQLDNITDLYKQLVAVRKPRLTGLMCLDVIDGRIIELNPRLTASAPIAHILQNQHKIHHLHGRKFHIRQIDLNTSVNLRYEYVADGALKQIIGDIRRKNHVLILPQGLNPFGNSRFIFINDDKKGSAQKRFLQMITSDQEPIRLARQPSKCLKS